MDRVTLIVTALGAGAAAERAETASPAVRDAYGSLKALAQERLAGRRYGKQVLAWYEVDPEAWNGQLTKELAESGAGGDVDLAETSLTLLSLVDDAGFRARKYTPLPKDLAVIWDRSKMIAGLVAEPFGLLSVGSVTIGAAILITVFSAARLDAVSNGNITTAQAILYSSGAGYLALTALLSFIPLVASLAFAILTLIFIYYLFWNRRRKLVLVGTGVCAAAVGIAAARVIATWVYASVLLLPLGLAVLILLGVAVAFLVKKLALLFKRLPFSKGRAKQAKGAPTQPKVVPAQTDDLSWIVNNKWRPDILLYLRACLVGGLMVLVLSSFYDSGMWLPPQRVQLHHGRPFTAYVLSRDSQGVELYKDETRLVETVSNKSVASINLCSFNSNSQTFSFSFLSLRMNRALNVSLASSVPAYKNETGYPSCPS